FQIDDVEFVAGFDVAQSKVGLDVATDILAPPTATLGSTSRSGASVIVESGIPEDDATPEQVARVASSLVASGAEVLLYCLPTGRPRAAHAYAEAELEARRRHRQYDL